MEHCSSDNYGGEKNQNLTATYCSNNPNVEGSIITVRRVGTFPTTLLSCTVQRSLLKRDNDTFFAVRKR